MAVHMPRSAATLVLALLAWCVALVCHASQDFLFYSSLGDSTHSSGLYGGPVSYQNNGQVGEMTRYGYDCVFFDSEMRSDIQVDWFDIDEKSEKVAFRLYTDDGSLTLAVGPICHRAPYCRNETQELKFREFPLLQHKSIGPIAYYHETIYFIYYDVMKKNDVKTSEIQLRKFSACEDMYPVTGASLFTIEECSKLLVTIVADEYEQYQRYRALDTLLAYGSGANPEFLVQIQETIYEARARKEVNVILKHVSSAGKVTSLHTERIDQLQYFALDIRQLGGISKRDSKVCWSPIDRVLCGDLSGKALSGVKNSLPTQEISSVCQGSSEPILANIVTGVAIAEAETELAFYFGCLAQIENSGGAGLVRIPNNGNARTVEPLRNGTKYTFAGSMQITDHCHWNPSQGAEVMTGAAYRVSSAYAMLFSIMYLVIKYL